MVGLLCWAIREAEVMGAQLVFEGAASVFRSVHFVAVSATFLALPVLVVTGVRLARVESADHRRAHRVLAWVFVGCVRTTTAIGTTMTLLASKAPADVPEAGSSADD